jgi:hypothetical protein
VIDDDTIDDATKDWLEEKKAQRTQHRQQRQLEEKKNQKKRAPMAAKVSFARSSSAPSSQPIIPSTAMDAVPADLPTKSGAMVAAYTPQPPLFASFFGCCGGSGCTASPETELPVPGATRAGTRQPAAR